MKMLPGNLLLATALLLFLILAGNPTAAQVPTGYVMNEGEEGDSVSRYIKRLTENKVDTVIRFDLPEGHEYSPPDKDQFPGYYPNKSFIFYRLGNKTYATKYCWLGIQDNKANEYLSEPRELPGDTLFSWFAVNSEQMSTYGISPFVYEVKVGGFSKYFPRKSLYSTVYNIQLYTAGNRSRKNINMDDMELRNRQNKINLNYECNTGSKIYRLFLMLELLSQQTFQTSDY